MEKAIVFTLNDGAFWLSIFVGVFGVTVIAGVIWFGREIFSRSLGNVFEELRMAIRDYLHFSLGHNQNHSNELKAIVESFADHRERRNEFFTLYGQVVLAIFIVVVLAILLITKTISAEAGLPILSAVSGFAIAKGVNSSKSPSSTIDPNNKEPRG